MLNERVRVKAQSTLDTAIVSASAITQERDPEQVVRDYMEAAGFDPAAVEVAPIGQTQNGSLVTGRSVAARMDIETSTIFMDILGIENFLGAAAARAEEGTTELEIALVLDISGSMNDNGKIDDLKVAAKDFVTAVLDNNDPNSVNISIVPYNHQVYMTDTMVGAIPRRGNSNPASRCARFPNDGLFNRRSILPGNGRLEMASVFVNDRYYFYEKDGVSNTPFAEPEEWSKWCNDYAPQVMLYSNNMTELHTYIDSLEALEGTAIDTGMKWGVAVLDPSMQPTIDAMVANNELPADRTGHPFDYADNDVLKFIILMSDGQNDAQYDLRGQYRSGMSRVWNSNALATAPNATAFDGFIVEMPDLPADQRWLVPGDPNTTADDYFLAEGNRPQDAQRWSNQRLYERFTILDAATYFFLEHDPQTYVDLTNAVQRVGNRNQMDRRTRRACNAAKDQDRITVFTVAFDAPNRGQQLLQNCATSSGHYFDVDLFGDGTNSVAEAFATIAAQLSVLRIIN